MLAQAISGKPLITIRPAHSKFSDISQILLDLQAIIGSPSSSLHIGSDIPKVLSFAAITPTSPRVARRGRLDGRPDHRSVVRSGIPRFMGSVPQGPQDDVRCWYCAGLLKTARQLFADTADKNAPVSSVRTAKHPFVHCQKFKADMVA